jgi:hypothetical protein
MLTLWTADDEFWPMRSSSEPNELCLSLVLIGQGVSYLQGVYFWPMAIDRPTRPYNIAIALPCSK